VADIEDCQAIQYCNDNFRCVDFVRDRSNQAVVYLNKGGEYELSCLSLEVQMRQ
jgi:hypothetical protein